MYMYIHLAQVCIWCLQMMIICCNSSTHLNEIE